MEYLHSPWKILWILWSCHRRRCGHWIHWEMCALRIDDDGSGAIGSSSSSRRRCAWYRCWRWCISCLQNCLMQCYPKESIVTSTFSTKKKQKFSQNIHGPWWKGPVRTAGTRQTVRSTHLYSSTRSGGFRICTKTGAHSFGSIARMCPAAIRSVLLAAVPFRCGSIRSEMNFKRGTMNTLITSWPNSPKPPIAPYSDDNCVLSLVNALLNSRVIRVCRLFVDAKNRNFDFPFQISKLTVNWNGKSLLTVEVLWNRCH